MRVHYFIDDRGEGCGHPSRGLPGMLKHRRVSLIIASCIVRAVPFGVLYMTEKRTGLSNTFALSLLTSPAPCKMSLL